MRPRTDPHAVLARMVGSHCQLVVPARERHASSPRGVHLRSLLTRRLGAHMRAAPQHISSLGALFADVGRLRFRYIRGLFRSAALTYF